MSWILPEHPWDKQVQTPQRWLELATAGLAEAAAEQVQAEYRARLTGALAAGQTEAEVLREWGDPNDAARAQLRVHLT
ncbi:MAG: hypothetical protein Q4C67_10090, partial [Deinococcus sp.]|nr:hypothetical protein [Deinococcus sp.]